MLHTQRALAKFGDSFLSNAARLDAAPLIDCVPVDDWLLLGRHRHDLTVIHKGYSMPRVAEAECATCHHVVPKTGMREVVVSRVVGRSSAFGQLSKAGDRRSSTFDSQEQWRNSSSNSSGMGASSRSSTRTRVERVWVCKGCKAPKSDGWFSSLLVKLLIAALALYIGANYLLKDAGRVGTPAQTSAAAPLQVPAASERARPSEQYQPSYQRLSCSLLSGKSCKLPNRDYRITHLALQLYRIIASVARHISS